MIISCIKCNKKFTVDDNLIPKTGRILECGSCSHQWHYIPVLVINESINTNKIENKPNDVEPTILDKEKNLVNTNEDEINPDESSKAKKAPAAVNNNKDHDLIHKSETEKSSATTTKKKKSNFLNILIVCIITFIALIIILDTFKDQLIKIFPSLELYLYSLYNIITDIFLFITNLLK